MRKYKKTEMIPLSHKLTYTLMYIRSDQLQVPREFYQKPLNLSRVKHIVADFDPNIANEPKVSYRDGHYVVFDGQHTVAALVARNGGEPVMIRCKVYSNLTPEQEAMLFAEQTGHAAKPTPGNCLRARLFASEKESKAFKEVTEGVGFKLNLDGVRGRYHIKCINTALGLFRKLGADRYKEALEIIYAAWDGNADSLRCEVITGVCEFIRLYHDRYNGLTLVKVLEQIAPRELCCFMLSDFEHKGYKRFVYPIFELYNACCGPCKLPLEF